MSDQLDGLFAGVRGVRPPADFAPPAQVRRRGRQRTRRTALGAGAGVLAVTTAAVGLGAGLLPGPDGVAPPADPTPTATVPTPTATAPSPAPSPSSPPASDRNPTTALLRPDDLGPGTWRRFEAEQMENRDRWFWGFWDGLCGAYESSLFPSLPHRNAMGTTAYQSPGGDTSVSQIVERYDAGRADDNLADVREVIQRCGTAVSEPDITVTVVGTGIAGDESLLVRQEQTPAGEGAQPQVDYIAVVRVGDLVTTVRAYPSEPDRVRDLAERAAARLK